MRQAIRRDGRVRRVAAVLAVVAGLALTGCTTLTTSGPATPSPSAPTVRAQPTAAAIGDSIAIGWGVPADDAWPLIAATRLGWDLTDLGEGGAGFTKPGVNTHDFDDQVSAAIRLRPQVVIVAATRNDSATAAAAPATVKRDTVAAIDRLSTALPRTTIVGMGSVWGATAADRTATVIDEALKSAVLAVGGHWLPLGQPFLGKPTLMQSDGIHPTSAGQSLLGRTVADAIAKARIEPGPARG
ncbi:SGNH/GDSL hydrolase family protein [Leifsonia sp. NPDC056824]|uniref:SGNH/GDSL hydrolase family protein n=1 Tax=Leifsonia sp. NPDC056824 TaxID=3345953 RepID=UPI0036BC4063